MLHLLVDTSTWLDLARRRDGQRWIVALRDLIHQHEVELLMPRLIIEREHEGPRAYFASVAHADPFDGWDSDENQHAEGNPERLLALTYSAERPASTAPMFRGLSILEFDHRIRMLHLPRFTHCR